MYIAPESKSPITLLELGLFAHYREKIMLCCPDGFYRKGNVDIIAKMYNMDQYDELDDLLIGFMEKIDYTY